MKLLYLLILLNGTALAAETVLDNNFSYTTVPYQSTLKADPSTFTATTTRCLSTTRSAVSSNTPGMSDYTYRIGVKPMFAQGCDWRDSLSLSSRPYTLTYSGCLLTGHGIAMTVWPDVTLGLAGDASLSFDEAKRIRTWRGNLYQWSTKGGEFSANIKYQSTSATVPVGRYTLSCSLTLLDGSQELSNINIEHPVSAYNSSSTSTGEGFFPSEVNAVTSGGSWEASSELRIVGLQGDRLIFSSSSPVQLSLGSSSSLPGTPVSTILTSSGLATGSVYIRGTASTPGTQVVNLHVTLQRK